MKSQYSIALLIETSSSYGRQILRGIQRFIQTENRQEWVAAIEERDVNAGVPDWIKNWSGDGIISRQLFGDLGHQIRDQGIAFVELTDRESVSDFTSVRSDDLEIGRLAADHFHDRGFTQFAFCGFSGEAWSDRRREGFERQLQSFSSSNVYCYQSDWYEKSVKRPDRARAKLARWLSQLPKPIGLMACNDVCGKQVIDGCHQASLPVPESVAIVGVDNDELLCSFCHPPLSSVMPNAETIGFRAAKILSRMLANKKHRARVDEVLIPPLGVFPRQSSDVVAVEDRDLAEALKFIRDHACESISVADVVKYCGVSRSTIERKMRQLIGRTPQQEIRRVRLRHACALLAGTDLSIEAVASECAYEHPEYLHVVFKREMQMTPGEYRTVARRS
ncbi:MAG: DNA-binding transcriptional regulator [Pirellulaceae bacterium]|nr:DNA-binding transcriptional regulator [Pirellulaceae bacterium]